MSDEQKDEGLTGTQRYAAALSAWNSDLGTRGHYGTSVAISWAADEHDAYKNALKAARGAFPPEKGWTQHNAVVLLIEDGDKTAQAQELKEIEDA